MIQNQAKELAEARENIANTQRVFQKIQQLIRIKLQLKKRRNTVLNDFSRSINNTGCDYSILRRLKPILEREKKVLGIIINEEDIETSNMYIAKQILLKFKKLNKTQKGAIEVELAKLGIKFSDLEVIAIAAMDILQKSKQLLKKIRERIGLEEEIIKPNLQAWSKFSAWNDVWHNETLVEIDFMEYVIIKANSIAKLKGRLNIARGVLDTEIARGRVNPFLMFRPLYLAIFMVGGIVGFIDLFVREGSVEWAQIIPEERNIYRALKRVKS